MARRSETDDYLAALAELPTLGNPTASPDGGEIALYYDVTGRNELHVLDAETGELTRWSHGEVPRDSGSLLRWDADGQRVFFQRDDDGDEQYDVCALDRDGSVEPVVESDGQNVVHDVAADGEFLVVASTRGEQLNLYRHDIDGGEATKLTDHDDAVWWSVLSPEADRIAYVTGDVGDFTVYVADVDGTDSRELAVGSDGSEPIAVDWSPCGERLLVGDDTDGHTRVGVYDLDADAASWLGDGIHEESPMTFLPDGERVLATRDRDATTVPVVYDVETGEGREFDLPDGVGLFGTIPRPPRNAATEAILDEDRVLLTHSSPTKRPELLAYDLSTDEREVLIEAEHGPFDPDDFADAEYLTFASDGVPETRQATVEHDAAEELEIGALLYDSGQRPSPLVVKPHGGPRGRDAKRFTVSAQMLAARGFSVLEVNYRGSLGRGREFVEALYGDWGGAEQGDVATGVEHVLATRDWIDAERVAVFGGSYGGYSAYWQLVQYPDIYDAGVAWNGLTDLHDAHENAMPHFRTSIEGYLGAPGENPFLYRERSPATHADRLDAPLLALHAVNDRRVPVSQARIFREALEAEGFEAGEGNDYEYRELDGEGHSTTDPDRRYRVYDLVVDFLERRLGARRVDSGEGR